MPSKNTYQQHGLIITGMHRSGTSLAAALLQRSGVFLGDDLIGPGPGNRQGHFESQQIVALQEKALIDLGINPLGRPSARKPSFTPDQRAMAQQIIESHQTSHRPWGFKDPRAVFFLDQWRALLPEARFLFLYRSPWAVVDSLFRRGSDQELWPKPEWAIGLWKAYNQKIIDFMRAHPTACVVMHADTLVSQQALLVETLNQRLGWSLNAQEDVYRQDLFRLECANTPGQALVETQDPEALEIYQALQALDHTLNLATICPDHGARTTATPYPDYAAWFKVHHSTRPSPGQTQPDLAPPAPLVGHLDTPVGRLKLNHSTYVSGWCAHPNQKILSLWLCHRNQRVRCTYPTLRDDVAAVYPDWVDPRHCGFEVQFTPTCGYAQVSLEALLETGERIELPVSPRWITLPNTSLIGWLVNWAQTATHPLTKSLGMGQSASLPKSEVIDRYTAWLKVNQWRRHTAQRLSERLKASTQSLPKLSVVMPVYNPEIEFLDKAIESVRDQVYTDWELCIADDASTQPGVLERLRYWASVDTRIHVCQRDTNGQIAQATNSAAALASGHFLVFLDQDDCLPPQALAEIALAVADNPKIDLLYTDDDKITPEGDRYAPQFKPDWSPELLLSYMYFSHALVIRRSLFESLGGLRDGFEGAQDYDLALRATEATDQIAHLPMVLYHWRATNHSTASSGHAKPASFEAGRRAVQEALVRRGIEGKVAQPTWAYERGLGLYECRFPHDGPSVTVIIPTKNTGEHLRHCLASLRQTRYSRYDILIIDNGCDDPAALVSLTQLASPEHPIKVVRIDSPDGFNFSTINNQAAQQTDAEYLVFLNDDTEVQAPEWLSQMMGYAQMDGVGAVGARLLFQNHTIQHAGIIHGLNKGLAGHAFKGQHHHALGYLCYANVARNCLGVTAACLLTPRALFLAMGGFNEQQFAMAYNDIDYAFRLHDAGYRSVFCPQAELFHAEGKTRGSIDCPKERAAFRRLYAHRPDPYYNPNLSLENEQFEVAARRLDPDPGQFTRQLCVLMCTHALDHTGAPKHQFDVAQALIQKDDFDIVVFSTADGPLRAAYEALGIRVVVESHPLAQVGHPDEYDEAIKSLSTTLSPASVDVVYANTLETFYMVDWANTHRLPSLWNIHESETPERYFAHLHPDIAARALNCFHDPYQVIFVSDTTRALFQTLNTVHNFATIPNGLAPTWLAESTGSDRVTARQSLEIDEDAICIILVGTVCERKGQHDLVHAISKLPVHLHAKLRCLIVGDRPSQYSTALANLASQLPATCQGCVEIVTETGDVAMYYAAADLFVCTSRVESYPRVILEAMAYGLPIITTPVFGIQEQIQEGINGLFYPPGDIMALAERLTLLLEHPEQRQRLASNARPMLESLNSFDDMIAGYEARLREAADTSA